MTKATDLKTIFLKSPWKMGVETCITLWYLFKTNKKYFYICLKLFFSIFSILPSTQTIKVIDPIFFQWASLEKLCYEHAFQPYTYSLRPFSRGGGKRPLPQAIHRFRPPSLFRVQDKWRECFATIYSFISKSVFILKKKIICYKIYEKYKIIIANIVPISFKKYCITVLNQ